MLRHLHRVVFIALVLCLISAGCGGSPTRPDGPSRSVDVRAGASALLQGGVTLTFTTVKSDARCPIDAICISEGDAVIAVSLSQPGRDRLAADLHTTAAAKRSVTYRGVSVTLTALTPYPRSDRPTRPEEYVATFDVAAQ